MSYSKEDYPLEKFPYGPAGAVTTQKEHDRVGDELSKLKGEPATFEEVNKVLNKFHKDNIPDKFQRRSADTIFDIINSPVGRAMLPGAKMINVIDRIIEGSITPEELEDSLRAK